MFGLLTHDAYEARPVPLRHPLVFYHGHIEAFAWNKLFNGLESPDPELDTRFARGIDLKHAPATGPLPWPDPRRSRIPAGTARIGAAGRHRGLAGRFVGGGKVL